MTVRRATYDDLVTVMNLSQEFWQTCQPEGPYEREVFIPYVRDNLDNEDFMVLLLNDNEGMMMATMIQTIFSSALVAKEIVWYTRPTARGQGMSLYREYVKWARARGAEHLLCTLGDVNPTMERLGFSRIEVGYIKHVGWQSAAKTAAQ